MKPWPASPIHLGTCSWTAEGWAGTFYQRVKQSNLFISEYAERFNAVEIDASFYGTPRRDTILRWRDLTPDGFTFAAKAPQIITHQKCMDGCEAELEEFLGAMELLGSRLGPLLFQFPYFAQRRGMPLDEFLPRLDRMLSSLPRNQFKFAVEVRNKQWLCAPLFEVLAAHQTPLAMIDHPWMPGTDAWFADPAMITGPFLYVRLLGDRKGIEQITQVWNKVVVDRRAEVARWAGHLRNVLDRGLQVYTFVNNHYSGYAAADVELLNDALGADAVRPPEVTARTESLFD